MKLSTYSTVGASNGLGICSTIFALTMSLANPVAALAAVAPSPLKVCNQISDNVDVAIGYFSSGINDTGNVLSGPFVSRGWWTVLPGKCRTFANPFNARYMFWWPVTHGLNDRVMVVQGVSAQTPESVHFCVPSYFDAAEVPSFTFEDENVSVAACQTVDTRVWVTPRQVDTFVESSVNITDSMIVK